MRSRVFGVRLVAVALLVLLALCLTACSNDTTICYYGYFEEQAFAFVYKQATNTLYGIRLPLEQILLWGKASGLDSIPIAMRNYVGLKESGFLIGSSDNFRTMCDLTDALGSESSVPDNNGKRLSTLASKALVLSKKPLSDKINQLCGPDSAGLLKLMAEKNPTCVSYDAHSFFDTDDLNFSQRYFTKWLEQVLGGHK